MHPDAGRKANFVRLRTMAAMAVRAMTGRGNGAGCASTMCALSIPAIISLPEWAPTRFTRRSGPPPGGNRKAAPLPGGGDPKPRWSNFADPLDAIGARFRENLRTRSQAGAERQTLGKADRQALSTLGLGADATRRTIRKAYSELVRRYHPDRNGGNRAHEKALQDVIAAYTHLKASAAFE